ncbi:hypothetical protein THIX_60292 [Thiomonas sp. X19]|nr:hypothetical protein THIX_60292 [Thiomonas sp. X19]
MVRTAQRCGIALKQTFDKEGAQLRRKAGSYAHARQFKRLKRVIKRQRTIQGILLREVERKRQGLSDAVRRGLDDLMAGRGASTPSSPKTSTSSMRCTPRKRSASPRAKPVTPTSSASRSAWR